MADIWLVRNGCMEQSKLRHCFGFYTGHYQDPFLPSLLVRSKSSQDVGATYSGYIGIP